MDIMQINAKKTWLYTAILSTLCIVLLTSCSTIKKRKDGPPNFYVDETKIPNAVPKPEPLAKFGNMPYYKVFGQRYYVMKYFKNYREIGTASWYGTLFHDRRTSSGEKYNMLAMTAAHRTLPLPTYVEVTNLANQKKIIVKVNDRGPFASNRIIDLSYIAAKKLGILGNGTAPVEVKAIDPYAYGKPVYLAQRHKQNSLSYQKVWQKTIHTKTVSKKYVNHHKKPQIVEITHTKLHQINLLYLQVGAFRDKNHAMRLKAKLASLLSAPIKVSYPTAAMKLYRVHIGPLYDLASVNAITQRLKSMGIKSNRASGV